MIYISRDSEGKINGVYGCPQPDAVDDNGNVICSGVDTSPAEENDPEVLAYLAPKA
jgi:hypothetical protein